MKNKGQISLGLASSMAFVSFIAAPIIAFYSSQMAISGKIADGATRTSVVEVRIDNLEKRFDKIDAKLDALLLKQGINPTLLEKNQTLLNK